VFNYEPRKKYGQGIQQDYGAIAAILEQLSGEPVIDLIEFVRRFITFMLMGNTDAHLKNWGLVYADSRTPRLAPLYDPVCVTAFFDDVQPLDYAVNRQIDSVVRQFSIGDLTAMLEGAGLSRRRVSQLRRAALETIAAAKARWPEILVDAPDTVRRAVDARLRGGMVLTS
jgi:serine/threonine-protein kinase HipA